MQAAYVMGDLGEYLSFLKKFAPYTSDFEEDGYLKSRVECAMAFCAAEGAEIEDIDVFIEEYLKRAGRQCPIFFARLLHYAQISLFAWIFFQKPVRT